MLIFEGIYPVMPISLEDYNVLKILLRQAHRTELSVFGTVLLPLEGIVLIIVRTGQVHRTLIGHTGPVSCLQFDNLHLVTGSLDRSIRIWDIRTGAMINSYTEPHGITSLHFDSMRIVNAAGEDG